MKADTICCYCISKRLTKDLQNHCICTYLGLELTACEVGLFSREQLPTIDHRPWVYSRDHSRSGVATLLL